jgi:hypothetical protein
MIETAYARKGIEVPPPMDKTFVRHLKWVAQNNRKYPFVMLKKTHDSRHRTIAS